LILSINQKLFSFWPLRYIAIRGKIRVLNQVQILDDQLANCDHEFILVKWRTNWMRHKKGLMISDFDYFSHVLIWLSDLLSVPQSRAFYSIINPIQMILINIKWNRTLTHLQKNTSCENRRYKPKLTAYVRKILTAFVY